MYVQIVRGNYDRCGRKKKYIKKLNLAELAQLLGLLCIFQLVAPLVELLKGKDKDISSRWGPRQSAAVLLGVLNLGGTGTT